MTLGKTKNARQGLGLSLGFGDEFKLWLSSGHILLSGGGLGLGFWVMASE